MTRTDNFYKWWTETVKGESITNEQMESIIIKNQEIDKNDFLKYGWECSK